MSPKARIFWTTAVLVLIADILTKSVINDRLALFQTQEVIGDFLRFTLSYNRGAAFGIALFDSRWVYAVLTVVIVMVLFSMYREAASSDRWQPFALGLIVGGALGNLWDRIRWERGVVDFIDVGIGTHRFWTFNIADSGITVGATTMIVLFLLHARRSKLAAKHDDSGAPQEGQ